MRIMKDDSLELRQMMEEKIKHGYGWMIYLDDSQLLRPEDIRFFKKFEEAQAFRLKNEPTVEEVILIQPVLKFLQDALPKTREDIGKTIYEAASVKIDMSSLKVFSSEAENRRRKAEALSSQLLEWGIKIDLTSFLEQQLKPTDTPIILNKYNRINNDNMDSLLFVATDMQSNYQLLAVTCMLKKHIEIPDLTINGISAKAIEREMRETQWPRIHPFISEREELELTQEKVVTAAAEILSKIELLSVCKEGKEVADKIMAKYWLGTGMEGLIENANELGKRYLIYQNFDRIGNDIFSEREIYNLLSERYVSKNIVEGGQVIQPWYYRHTQSGASASNIIRITASENLDMEKQVQKLIDAGMQLEYSKEEFIKRIRRGDEVQVSQYADGYKWNNSIYFNPFLNEMEISKVGSKIKIDQSEDLGKDLRQGPPR